MQRHITRGAAAGAGLIFHIFAQDSAATNGAGKASIAFGSWSCRYIRNGEAISGAITPEDITTIGTYAAPTANTNIRIKAVDNTNMIGVYEVHIHSDWVNATNNCQSLTIFLTASGVAPIPIQIPLIAANVQDGVRLGLTALPNAAADAAGGLPISDAGGLDLDAQRTDIAAILVDTGTTLDGRLPAALVGGRMDASVGAMAVDTITNSALAASAVTEIQSGLALEATAQAVKAKTDNLPVDPADASDVAAALATISGYTDSIESRLPAALVNGRMDVSVSAIGDDTTALAAFKRAVLTNVIGTVGAASTTTNVVTSSLTPAASVTDQFKGLIIKFDKDTTTAALRGQASDITAGTAGGELTVTALTTAPVSGDTFAIL